MRQSPGNSFELYVLYKVGPFKMATIPFMPIVWFGAISHLSFKNLYFLGMDVIEKQASKALNCLFNTSISYTWWHIILVK